MLYIMRHGTTDWNVKRKLQGKTDIPLNEEGRSMAAAAAERYRDVPIDVCYCSPLIRAKETAELVLKGRDIPIITDRRLEEMGFGIYEGIENSFSIPDCPVNELFFHPETYKAVENGEELSELFARTGEFLKTVVEPELQKGRNVLIVGHGAMNASIVCQERNLPVKEFWSAGLKQCELLRLR